MKDCSPLGGALLVVVFSGLVFKACDRASYRFDVWWAKDAAPFLGDLFLLVFELGAILLGVYLLFKAGRWTYRYLAQFLIVRLDEYEKAMKDLEKATSRLGTLEKLVRDYDLANHHLKIDNSELNEKLKKLMAPSSSVIDAIVSDIAGGKL